MKKNFCVVMVSAFLVEMIKAMNPGSDVPHPITVPQHYIALVNLVNDLQPEDVDERALLDALAAKNIDILSNRQYCPMNVLSLKEYLRFLINDRFDAEAVNGYKTEKVARFALLERIPKAVAYFYDKMLKENNSLRRDALFTNKLIGLLMKAQSGVDYTKEVDENDDRYEDSMRVTIAGTAKGYGVDRHASSISFNPDDAIPHENWKKANRLVSDCLHHLLNGELHDQDKAHEIEQKIDKVLKLLPERKLSTDAQQKIFRIIDEAYTIINEYIVGNKLPPD